MKCVCIRREKQPQQQQQRGTFSGQCHSECVFDEMKEEITRAKDRSLKIASRGRKRERERVVVARRRRRRRKERKQRDREKRERIPRARDHI